MSSLLDAYGNYTPVMADDGISSFPTSNADVLSGTGAPASSLGSNGNIYVDTATGKIYTKSGGAWTAAVGGTVQVLTGAFANPNGNVTPADPTKPAIYYQEGNGAGTPLFEWSVANQVFV